MWALWSAYEFRTHHFSRAAQLASVNMRRESTVSAQSELALNVPNTQHHQWPKLLFILGACGAMVLSL